MNLSNNSKIYFYGGVGSVTGANFIFENGNTKEKLMIDCGLIQGGHFAEEINHQPFAYNVSEIKALLVTHAHIDHIGRIPKLVKDGFKGEIWSTNATKEIVYYMFTDALKIMEEEASKHGISPIYKKIDADNALSLWKTIDYHQPFKPMNNTTVTAMDAGHILGSAMYEINDKQNKIIFTGDLGNSPSPLLPDTENIKQADYLIMESVYGDRNHQDIKNRKENLLKALKKAIDLQGAILIPAFSLEKTQVILSELNNFVETGKIKSIPVFLDSPLAIKVTNIYKQNFKLFNKKSRDKINAGDDLFDFPKLKITPRTHQSEMIDNVHGSKIILAGSGMSSGGRILKHELTYLKNPKSTIIFLGYQTTGTLGRKIQEGIKKLQINKNKVFVKANIISISGYSSHKGGDDLLDFVSNITGLKKVFVTMGEPRSSNFLSNKINDYLDIKAVVPEVGDVVELE